MTNISVGLLFLFFFLAKVDSAKILVYSPSISMSHILSNGRIADALVRGGHSVTMLITEYKASTSHFNGTKLAKVRRLNGLNTRFEDDVEMFTSSMFDASAPTWDFGSAWGMASALTEFEDSLTEMCESLVLRLPELDDLRNEGFDLAFSEQVDLCGIGIIHYLGIPKHIWVSTTALMDAVSYNLAIPAPVAYVPVVEENDLGDRFGFSGRLQNLLAKLRAIYVHRYGTDKTTAMFRRHLGASFPHVRDLARDSTLCMVNTDETLEFARPILHKTIYIGGLGTEVTSQSLPQEWELKMSKGAKGVILFSFGTVVPWTLIPLHIRDELLAAFGHFKDDYHVLVRVDDVKKAKLDSPNIPSNVELVNWLPQSQILASPRLRLFVMHGGLNGMLEAVREAVPMLIVPIFADQFRNGRNAERRGFGRVVGRFELTRQRVIAEIAEMLKNPRYKEMAERHAALMRARPWSAEERLVKWTNFALEHDLLDILSVEGAYLGLVEYYALDAWAVVIGTILTIFSAVLLILVWLTRYLLLLCKSVRSQRPKTE